MARPKMCKKIFREPKIRCFKPDVDLESSQIGIHRNHHG